MLQTIRYQDTQGLSYVVSCYDRRLTHGNIYLRTCLLLITDQFSHVPNTPDYEEALFTWLESLKYGP